MAYQINKTSGALLVNLADGQIDVESTDITLIGKNYTGFGESINENLINLQFNVEEGEKFYVDRINILGNNITAESVIRNQLMLD